MTTFVKGFAIKTPYGQVDVTAEEGDASYIIRLAWRNLENDDGDEMYFTLDEATLVFGAGNQLVQNARGAAEAEAKERATEAELEAARDEFEMALDADVTEQDIVDALYNAVD